MAEFTPITTQEEFDSRVKDRLAQKDRQMEEKYKEYVLPEEVENLKKEHETQLAGLQKTLDEMKAKTADHDREIAERDARIKDYETASVKARIAHETGIPYEMASRLNGEDEEAIRKDAESLKSLMGTKNGYTPPEPTHETGKADKETAAYKALLNGLKGGN